MSASRGGERGSGPRFPGVLEGMLAAAVGGGLTQPVKLLWEHVTHQTLPGWAEAPVPNVLGVALLMGLGWFLGRWAHFRRAGKTAKARGNKLSIYVAHFGFDEDGPRVREAVIRSLEKELGPECAEIVPAALELKLDRDVGNDSALLKPNEKARKLLKRNGGDLLIWGSLRSLAGSEPCIELHFVTASSEHSRPEPFLITKGMLEPAFAELLGVAIAAVAATSAAPSVVDSGKYLVETLEPIARRLGPLIQRMPPGMTPENRASLLHSFALVESTVGEQSGQARPLERAVAAYRQVIQVWTREHAPLQWAMTQNNLGNALQTLGARESGTETLQEAVAAYREALKEYTRERVPLDWATTQNNLGAALRTLGERESGTEKLQEAVGAYREALKEYTRERVPLKWATTQNNLGNALRTLGARENGTEKLQEAVAAYREALKEYTRERVPLDWAATQNNLGAALQTLGARENGTETLQEAVAAYREALKERTRERVPLDWAATQNNLGIALGTLGERESGTETLQEAVAAFREALKERTRERVPLDWAATQNNLGNALGTLGERESGTEKLQEAVAACREALEEWTSAQAPYYHQIASENLQRALDLIEERKAAEQD